LVPIRSISSQGGGREGFVIDSNARRFGGGPINLIKSPRRNFNLKRGIGGKRGRASLQYEGRSGDG